MKDIKDIRGEIDSIDQELARLFRRRLEIVADVAASKHARGAPVTDPARERDILSRVTAEVGPEYENGARLFFATLFGIAKARQRTMLNGEAPLVKDIRAARAAFERFPNRAVVACPGTEGSYAQQATSIMFQLPTILYFTSFDKVFEAVEQGLCPYGILPIENSAAGSVAAVYDLMVKLSEVREVISHPHALAQCGEFLKAHPEIKAVPGANTAVGAKALSASGRRDAAVIASRACAELYGLDVIAEDIADAVYNYTRFICISKDLQIYPDANKFSIMLSLPHRPGSLNGLISKFAAINVNLTKLESRPIPGMDFEFRFTFDFEAPPSDPAVLGLLAELAQDPEIEHFTFLGAYAER